MKSPHYANESQNSFKLDLTRRQQQKQQQKEEQEEDTDQQQQQLDNIFLNTEKKFSSLRLILRQPSSVWDKFGIDNIRLYKSTTPIVDKSRPLQNDEKTLQSPGHPFGSVVESVQELSKQIQSIRSHYVDFDPAPFDIGGCYDINLLSYT